MLSCARKTLLIRAISVAAALSSSLSALWFSGSYGAAWTSMLVTLACIVAAEKLVGDQGVFYRFAILFAGPVAAGAVCGRDWWKAAVLTIAVTAPVAIAAVRYIARLYDEYDSSNTDVVVYKNDKTFKLKMYQLHMIMEKIYSEISYTAHIIVPISIIAEYWTCGAASAWMTAATCSVSMIVAMACATAASRSFRDFHTLHLLLPLIVGTVSTGVACGVEWWRPVLITMLCSAYFAFHSLLRTVANEAGVTLKGWGFYWGVMIRNMEEDKQWNRPASTG